MANGTRYQYSFISCVSMPGNEKTREQKTNQGKRIQSCRGRCLIPYARSVRRENHKSSYSSSVTPPHPSTFQAHSSHSRLLHSIHPFCVFPPLTPLPPTTFLTCPHTPMAHHLPSCHLFSPPCPLPLSLQHLLPLSPSSSPIHPLPLHPFPCPSPPSFHASHSPLAAVECPVSVSWCGMSFLVFVCDCDGIAMTGSDRRNGWGWGRRRGGKEGMFWVRYGMKKGSKQGKREGRNECMKEE